MDPVLEKKPIVIEVGELEEGSVSCAGCGTTFSPDAAKQSPRCPICGQSVKNEKVRRT